MKEISCWKYCDVAFTDITKDANDYSKVATEILPSGVWYMKNINVQDDEEIEINCCNEVFVTNIPLKYHMDPEIVEAKNKELEKWSKYDAYGEVEFKGQHVLGSR